MAAIPKRQAVTLDVKVDLSVFCEQLAALCDDIAVEFIATRNRIEELGRKYKPNDETEDTE